MLHVVKTLWWPLVTDSCYYTVKLQSSLWKVNRDSYVRKHDFYQSTQRDISCVPTPILSYHKVCQKQIYSYQDAQLHSVVFYSMQATMFFCQFWPTILCAAAATSRRLSHREHRRMTAHWQMTEVEMTADSKRVKVQGSMLWRVGCPKCMHTAFFFKGQLPCLLNVIRRNMWFGVHSCQMTSLCKHVRGTQSNKPQTKL